jgi:DNA-binding NtrC family response regulator
VANPSHHQALGALIGNSQSMQTLRQRIRTAAAYPSTVLITGESGTGKELVARALHALSPRAAAPFVTVDCTLLADSLFESLLFGHEKGSFTGATTSTTGLARAAHGGTLFLDEVGELTAPGQAKLLRLLQERTVTPVGATTPIPVDIRIVAATHRDLQAMVRAGAFRGDLYYRLNVISVHTPSLRDRADDLPLLCDALMDRLSNILGVQRELTPDALDLIQSYSWPGNVRELAACLERATVLATGDSIQPHDLGCAITPQSSLIEPRGYQDAQRRAVFEALTSAGGNKAQAARVLGVDRRQLYRLIDRFKLPQSA